MKKLLSALTILLVLVGCNHTSYYSQVRSQSVGQIHDKFYYLMPLYKGVKPGDIHFVNNSKILNHTLEKFGMDRTDHLVDADIVVRFVYGIDSQQEVGSYTVYDTSTINTTSTTRSIYTGNTYTTNGTATVRTPRTKVYTYTSFNRRAVISFIDNIHFMKTKEIKELSRLEIVSNGRSSNLNAVLRVVLRAALPYVGTNRSTSMKIVWDNDNKKFIKIKGLSEADEKIALDFLNKDWLNITDITD